MTEEIAAYQTDEDQPETRPFWRPKARPEFSAFRMSDEVDQIAAALADAYANMGQATKDADNPFFRSKYADLSAVDSVIRPALSDAGVFVLQTITKTASLGMTLTTRLMHKSGQWIDSDVVFVEPQPYQDRDGNLVAPTSQMYGSAQTYARRYGLMAAVGLAVSDGTDDDGNAAAAYQRNQSVPRPAPRPAQAPAKQVPTHRGGPLGGDWVMMNAKIDGKSPCSVCGDFTKKGEPIAWSPSQKKVLHASCYEDLLRAEAAQGDNPQPTDDDLPF